MTVERVEVEVVVVVETDVDVVVSMVGRRADGVEESLTVRNILRNDTYLGVVGTQDKHTHAYTICHPSRRQDKSNSFGLNVRVFL